MTQMNLSTGVERRMLDVAELRLDDDGEARTIRGYAAVFDSLSQPIFGFREVIRKGTFKKTVRESDIRALWNHDPNYVLGRKSARTLRLEEDEKGLLTRIFPPSTQWARDLMTSIERGDVSQMSFGFNTIKDRWLPAGEDGLPVRELLEVRLLDVSPVTFPAYQQTEVHVRAWMDSVISRLDRGIVSREERRAMRLALKNILDELDAEPGEHHSDNGSTEPGQSHSEERDGREPGQSHSEEHKRTLLERRKRLLELSI
jgi:HK97 family phage prohead protease